jgi:hypothetical protein
MRKTLWMRYDREFQDDETSNADPLQGGLPVALAAAIAEAQQVLSKHDKFSSVLTETGLSIPAALASERELTRRLGMAEVAGDAVDALRADLPAPPAAVQPMRAAGPAPRKGCSICPTSWRRPANQ